jgi:hypothetical protein
MLYIFAGLTRDRGCQSVQVFIAIKVSHFGDISQTFHNLLAKDLEEQ